MEEKIGATIQDNWHLMTWIVAWVALLLRRYRVGDDGQMTYERLKGKRPSRAILPFGERVLFAPVRSSAERIGNTEPRFYDGIVVGMRNLGRAACVEQ